MSEKTYSLGRVGLRICGDYDAAANYDELDVVYYNGSSYVALGECTNAQPGNSSMWALLARGNPMNSIDYADTLPATGTAGQVILVPAS